MDGATADNAGAPGGAGWCGGGGCKSGWAEFWGLPEVRKSVSRISVEPKYGSAGADVALAVSNGGWGVCGGGGSDSCAVLLCAAVVDGGKTCAECAVSAPLRGSGWG